MSRFAWMRHPLTGVLLLALLGSGLWLGSGQLIDWDENIYAATARGIWQHGTWLTPTLNGETFTEKPPLVLWEMALSFGLFGVSEAAARLPSALNGLVFLAALWGIGARWGGRGFATRWALLYGFAFFPLFLSRSAVIDHSFNALMGLATFALVEFDEAYGRFRTGRGRRLTHWLWLLGAALALGLAVLAKGPLGGVVPLVAFAGMKLVRRRPFIHPGHVLVCGVLSLALGGSWYAANLLLEGGESVRGFARFMGLLFSKPLEGHTGPPYYHLLAVLLGFLPFTPLLLLYLRRELRQGLWAVPRWRALIALSVAWGGFVLLLFSLVQTKLPHYSSVTHLPLSLLAALALEQLRSTGRPVPRGIAGTLGGVALLTGLGLAVLPFSFDLLARQAGVALQPPPPVPVLAWLPGLLLAGAGLAGAVLLARGRLTQGLATTALGMALLMPGLWRVQLPLMAAYNQGPVLALMDEAYAAGGRLVLYRHVSFAVLFYGGERWGQPVVPMLHTYKFNADPALLDGLPGQAVYVVAKRKNVPRLLREHPGLLLVRDLGDLALYLRPAL